jgi:GNAT superfamily N-acetyltransferase
LRELGREVCAWAGPSGLPYLVIVTHEAVEAGVDANGELAASGLAPLMPLTGMIAGRVGRSAQLPEGLQLKVPDDDAGCESILDINTAAYGVSLDAAKPQVGRAAFWEGKVPVLGVAGGRPVASTAVFPVDGYRYVALVATQPGEQRKGYADAVMRHALEESAKRYGDWPTVLHATDAGRPIYERMGYARLALHTAYIEERFLGPH